MITLYRMFKLFQLKMKWQLGLYQQLEHIAKNPEELQQKLVHEIAEIIHKSNESKENI